MVCLLTRQIAPCRHVLVPIVHLIPSMMPGHRKGLDKYPLNTNGNKLRNALYLCSRPAKSKTGLQVLFHFFKTHYITGEISLSITISRATVYTNEDYKNSDYTNSNYTTVAHTCHPHLT